MRRLFLLQVRIHEFSRSWVHTIYRKFYLENMIKIEVPAIELSSYGIIRSSTSTNRYVKRSVTESTTCFTPPIALMKVWIVYYSRSRYPSLLILSRRSLLTQSMKQCTPSNKQFPIHNDIYFVSALNQTYNSLYNAYIMHLKHNCILRNLRSY